MCLLANGSGSSGRLFQEALCGSSQPSIRVAVSKATRKKCLSERQVWEEKDLAATANFFFPDFPSRQALLARRLQTILPWPVLTADRQTVFTSSRDLLLQRSGKKVCIQQAIVGKL